MLWRCWAAGGWRGACRPRCAPTTNAGRCTCTMASRRSTGPPRRAARESPAKAAGWTQLRLEEPAPASVPLERPLPAVSGEIVAVLVADLAAELGDAAHAAAHQETATVLWRRSGLPEGEFVRMVWEVRGRLKRRPATRQGAGPVRVAAFF